MTYHEFDNVSCLFISEHDSINGLWFPSHMHIVFFLSSHLKKEETLKESEELCIQDLEDHNRSLKFGYKV